MGVVSCGTTMLDQGVFENIGSVTWDTTAKTSGFTAVSGNGYFCNTTSAAFTVTLPSSPSAGNIVGIKDYANTADTNNITIGRNGSNIQGTADDYIISTEGRSVFLVYVDATKGWLVTGSAQASNIVSPLFVTATGGTITCCGDYKIHTFTGPGTFTVTCAGNAQGSTSVDYLVIAGGGGGGSDAGGGGGAGGYRESSGAASGCYTRSPLGACVSALPVSVTGYPITVGGGGGSNTKGNPSIFSSITSAGGGTGNGTPACTLFPGGSGGGGRFSVSAGTGNTPPVSPPQGNNGGNSAPPFGLFGGGGGGGATAVGSPGGSPSSAGPGGAGATSSINATPTTRAGGGGGGGGVNNPSGGTGAAGGGNGANKCAGDGSAATTNSGSGGGAGGEGAAPKNGGNGGSGIVIIRYKFQ